MKLESKKVSVPQPPDAIENAVLSGALAPFLKKSSLLRTTASAIEWKPEAPRNLVGKMPYWKDKNASGFIFRIAIEPAGGGGSAVSISATPNAFVKIVEPLVYIIGLAMCIVGVLLPVLGLRFLTRRLDGYLGQLSQAISGWSSTARVG